MKMRAETKNRKAFEFVTDALRDIDLYRRSKDPERLRAAGNKLDLAKKEDPSYMRPDYYLGILHDLMGKPKDAVDLFERLLDENPPFQDELRYNLGLAYYHQYSWLKLDKAIVHFDKIIQQSKNPSLRLLANANLAQAYAMHMIPPSPDQVDVSHLEKLIKENFDKVEQLFKTVTGEISIIRKRHDKGIPNETLDEAEWSIHNARAMSIMYSTDYLGKPEEKVRLLEDALKELEKARVIAGENWANHSDLGSCHMRLGHYRQSSNHFEKALDYLQSVVTRLRPDYGFALYEIGRTYRLQGRFDDALQYFGRSLAISRNYRDVGDERVQREIALAQEQSTKYP